MTPRPATIPELIALLTPFAGTWPRNPVHVDILHTAHKINAPIVAVTGEGIRTSWSDQAEFIPWAAVRRITLRTLSDDGMKVIATRVFEPLADTFAERRAAGERVAA